MRKKTNSKWLWRLLAPVVLLGFLWLKLDGKQILNAILSTRLDVLLAALILFAWPIPLRAWRWQMIMKTNGVHCRWSDTFLFYLIGYSGQFFLPTGLGDTIRIFYLVEDGHPPTKSFVSILTDKLSDYSSYVFFGLLGFSVFPMLDIAGGKELALVILGLLVGALLILHFRRNLQTVLRKRFDNLINRQMARLAAHATSEVWRDLRKVTFKQAMNWGLISIFIALVHNSSFYLLSLSLNLNLSYFQALGIGGILNMILSTPFLSLSVGGFGVREGLLVAIFSILGRSAESAIAFSLLMFAISTLWHCVALLAWLRRPINLRNLHQQARTLMTRRGEESASEIIKACDPR